MSTRLLTQPVSCVTSVINSTPGGCFFLNSFLRDAASQCRLRFTLWFICRHHPARHSPLPLQRHAHRQVGAISLLERAVTHHQLCLANPTFLAAQPKEAGLRVFPDLTSKIIPPCNHYVSWFGSFFLLLLFVWFMPSFHSNGFIFVAVSVFVHSCSRYQQHD